MAPYYENWKPHLNSRNDLLVLAPDKIISYLIESGHEVECINILEERICYPLFCSKQLLKISRDISNWKFDIVWHCVKDPTPKELIQRINTLTIKIQPKKILNNYTTLMNWTKPHYYKIINTKIKNITPKIKNTKTSYLDLVIPDRNNDRHLSKNIIVEYIDNIRNGKREFFRVPYCCGKLMSGYLYRCRPEDRVPKTGAAVERIEHTLKGNITSNVGKILYRNGLDIAHIEGFSDINNDIKLIFDINPFPCSDGKTFNPMSKLIVQRLEQLYA
jgi:hypothetical protein